MRIDREAFLLAVSALAGCERADTLQTRSPPVASTEHTEAQRPAASASMFSRETAPAPTPAPIPDVTPPSAPKAIADVSPPPAPKAKAATGGRRVSAAKR